MNHFQQSAPNDQPSMMNEQMVMNMIYVTVGSLVITQLTNFITKGVEYIFNALHSLITWIYTSITNKYYAETTIPIIGKMEIVEILDRESKLSNTYRAILFKLNQKKINIVNGRILFKNEYDQCCISINHADEIVISKKRDIRVKSIINKQNIENKENIPPKDTEVCTTIVYSTKLTVNEIGHVLKKWRQKYEKHVEKETTINDPNIYYYHKANIKDKDNNWNKECWSRNIMTSSKRFDNTFFTEKNKVLERLDYFLNNETEYNRRGIPYNMGFLFYGNPGCGKTSCIKAMANLTKRHVMEVNLKNINTCGDFIEIFTKEVIENKWLLPINKKIIVLEDIDCMLDIVKDRKQADDEKEHIFQMLGDNSNISRDCDKFSAARSLIGNSYMGYGDKLTLACILNIIDGVLEQHGRIIVVSSNYPDKLDKALTRPGRIDVKVNFTKCTDIMIRDMIEHFYEKKINDVFPRKYNKPFPDGLITPAELLEKCLENSKDMESVLSYVKTLS